VGTIVLGSGWLGEFSSGFGSFSRVVDVVTGLPSLEIKVEFEGNEFTEEDKKDLLKPLTDVDNLETGLNIPISHKIVSGHNGSFDIRTEGDKNIFIMNIPAIDRRATSGESDTG